MKYGYNLMVYYSFPGKTQYKIKTSRCKTVENCLKSVRSRRSSLSGKYVCAYEIYDKENNLVKKEAFSECNILGVNPTILENALLKNKEDIICDFEELLKIIDSFRSCRSCVTLTDESKESIRNIKSILNRFEDI